MNCFPRLPIWAFAALLPLALHPRLPAEELRPSTEIGGWGQATDPDGDCKFLVSEGILSIVVPGGDRPHDLAAEIGTINAPRVLQARADSLSLAEG